MGIVFRDIGRIREITALWPFFVWLFLMSGCAATYVQDDSTSKTQPALVTTPLSAYSGPKTVVAVLPLGLSEQAAKRYPRLLDKSVGMGIHNMVVEAMYDSNRFTFVKEKPEIIKDVMNRQWMSSAGMVDQGTAVEMGRMLGAKKVIYGEVYDYAEGGDGLGRRYICLGPCAASHELSQHGCDGCTKGHDQRDGRCAVECRGSGADYSSDFE
ncbi:MAG: CsgG/HfaB family protein [Dissulfuribacterales bacterium]